MRHISLTNISKNSAAVKQLVNNEANEDNEDNEDLPIQAVLPTTKGLLSHSTSQTVTVIQSSSPTDINNLESPLDPTTNSDSPADRDINNLETPCNRTSHSPVVINNSDAPCNPITNSASHSPVVIKNLDAPCDPITNSASHSPIDINNSDIPCDPTTTKSDTSQPETLAESADTDVVMRDMPFHASPSSGTQNDKDLPSWLIQMIVYLRGVSDAPAWHELVSGLIDFEKCGPPHGVSSCWFEVRID